jgi:hypothetical protein
MVRCKMMETPMSSSEHLLGTVIAGELEVSLDLLSCKYKQYDTNSELVYLWVVRGLVVWVKARLV